MAKIDRQPSKVPLAFLMSLALIVAVEMTLGALNVEPVGKVDLSWDFTVDATVDPASRSEVLCLGDSLTKLGVQPLVLGPRSGHSAYNLAIPGAQPATAVLLFDRAWRSGFRPRAIVLNTDANLLAVSPSFNRHVWGRVAGLGDGAVLAWRSGDPNLFARIATAQLASVRERETWRALAVSAISGRPIVESRADGHLLRNWRANRGAQLSAADPLARHAEPTQKRSSSWHPHDGHVAYLRELFRSAQGRNLRVFWTIPPATAGWEARRKSLGIDEKVDAFAGRLADEFPNVTLVDGRGSQYPDALFRDPTHLNRHGAIRYSTELADTLREAIDGRDQAKRLALRSASSSHDHAELEDVDQSRDKMAALPAAGTIRR